MEWQLRKLVHLGLGELAKTSTSIFAGEGGGGQA